MNYLISGATGFVGTHLLNHLRGEGQEVQRPELVGVFHSWDQTAVTTTKELSLFGNSRFSVQSTSKEKVRSLAFSPISGACQALGLHRD